MRFFGYQATNKCCRDWMLLGWPSDERGNPQGRDESPDPVLGVECPKCGKMIYFDLHHWDIVNDVPREEYIKDPASWGSALVGGRIRV